MSYASPDRESGRGIKRKRLDIEESYIGKQKLILMRKDERNKYYTAPYSLYLHILYFLCCNFSPKTNLQKGRM